MIDSLLSTSDQLLANSIELLDSSIPPFKISSTTDSSTRLIKRPAKLEIQKIPQLDFLMSSKSHNSLDEDEAHREADSSCLCHQSCTHFKRCEKIKNGFPFSGQNQIKEKNKNEKKSRLDFIKDDEEGQNNSSTAKEEGKRGNLYHPDEDERSNPKKIENESTKNNQFFGNLLEESYFGFREIDSRTKEKFNFGQDDEKKYDFISKMKQHHINEKLLTFKQKKMACILAKNTKGKHFLENDFSDEDSEREEMSSHSNSLASFAKYKHGRMKMRYLEDFEEKEDEEEEDRKNQEKEQEFVYIRKEVGKKFEDVLKEKETVNENDLLQKYEFDDEIVGDGFDEEGGEKEEEASKEALIIRRLEVN